MSTLRTLLRDGLRLALLRAPRKIPAQVGISPVLLLVALDALLGLPRVWSLIEAPRTFAINGLAGPLIALALLLVAGAALARLAQRPTLTFTVAAWLAAAGLVPTLAGVLPVATSFANEHLAARWVIHVVWWCAIVLRLAWFLAPGIGRALAGAAAAAAISVLPWLAMDVPELIETDWLAHYEQMAARGEGADYREPGELSDPEATFHAQTALLERALEQLAPQRPGQIDLYVLGFAGDASEGAFRNEVDFLPELAAHRFDAAGRSLRLVNHPGSADAVPLATATNLERALRGIGQRMDVDEDILFLYLSSHGSEDPELYVNQPPLPLDQLDPARLRDALDAAGIRWRVIVISACYSGGFIDTLRGPRTLVITAARADRTSFGCGNSANATWFGQAFLVDGLNHTTSFRRAFLRARHRIAEREKAEEYDPSEPQWAAGEAITERLARWRDALPPGRAVSFIPSVQVVDDDSATSRPAAAPPPDGDDEPADPPAPASDGKEGV